MGLEDLPQVKDLKVIELAKFDRGDGVLRIGFVLGKDGDRLVFCTAASTFNGKYNGKLHSYAFGDSARLSEIKNYEVLQEYK
ncbi:MAG TPA: hypothetical protein VKE88_00290 [Candidatus Nanoarchaeia archaeon]|nr:hypothetical protein [Candidatus Nanoarchaeia archaeon]